MARIPYHSVHDIPNSEYNKHYKRVEELDKQAREAVKLGKTNSYDEEATRLTAIQARKITDAAKAYGRAMVAEEHGFYAIAARFMSTYRFLTQTRSEKISSLLDDL